MNIVSVYLAVAWHAIVAHSDVVVVHGLGWQLPALPMFGL
jgi:hypothetical protein